jgi:hypothetical protein
MMREGDDARSGTREIREFIKKKDFSGQQGAFGTGRDAARAAFAQEE